MNFPKHKIIAARFAPFVALGLAVSGVAGMSFLAGCGSGGHGSSPASAISTATGRATVKITWPAAASRLVPAASSSILVVFQRNSATVASQIIARPTGSDTTTTTISNLPVGTLTVQIAAYPNADATGVAQAGAGTTTDITNNGNTNLTVTLGSTIDHLTVTPAAPSVVVGASTTLSTAAYNSAGDIVLTTASKITYSSANTSVATVDSSGNLTGVSAGTSVVTVTETESGKSAAVTATVTTSATPTPSPSGSATPTPTPSPTTGTTIVDLANAYIATLSSSQQAVTVTSGTVEYAEKWSNLPGTPSGTLGTDSRRNGVAYSTLTTAQQTAWNNLVNAVLAQNSSNGLTQFNNVRAADNYLGTNLGANGYSGNYQYLAFVGTPSTSGNWMLQLGGHHNAHNYYYTGNTVDTTTPYHLGVEPTSFTYGGTAYTPLSDQKTAVTNLLSSFSTSQLTSAKISGNFGDLYLGAGQDARSDFPSASSTTGRGVLVSSLTTAQQALVQSVIDAWCKNSPLKSTYESTYFNEFGSTYVGYAGNSSAPGTVFTAQGDYLRIDGPHVWIEFVCQNGVVVQGQIHYHTIWRDRTSDYNYQTAGWTLYNHSN